MQKEQQVNPHCLTFMNRAVSGCMQPRAGPDRTEGPGAWPGGSGGGGGGVRRGPEGSEGVRGSGGSEGSEGVWEGGLGVRGRTPKLRAAG